METMQPCRTAKTGPSKNSPSKPILVICLLCAYATLRVWYSLVVNAQAIVGTELDATWAAQTVATVSMVARLAVDVLVFAFANRIGSIVSRPPAVWGCTLTLVLSVVFVGAATHGWFGGRTLLIVGGALCGFSWELMALMWTEAFVSYHDRAVERFILVKIALDAVLYPLCLLPFDPVFILCLLLPIACALGLLGTRKSPSSWKAHPTRRWNRITARASLPLFCSVALLFVGFNLATTGAIAPISQDVIAELPSNVFTTLVGRWVALALMMVVMRLARDSHFEVYFAAAALVTIAGLLVLPLSETAGHPVYHVAMIVAAFVAENGIILTTVSVARYSTQVPLKVLAAGRVCLRTGAAVGILLSQATAGIFAGTGGEDARANASALLVMLVVVTAMWLLREQAFSGFLWGDRRQTGDPGWRKPAIDDRAPAPTSDEPTSPIPLPSAAKRQKLADEFGLTPRETEVLGLLLEGRSIPYIKETLHVSGDTVKTHVRHIYQKTDIHNRQDLISFAQEQ